MTEAQTIGAVARLLDVSVRQLQHWDRVGLATASTRSAGGYRLYSDADVVRLRRVLIYRRLGLGLDEIRTLLDAPARAASVLAEHRAALAREVDELRRLEDATGRLGEAHETGWGLDEDTQRAAFGPGWDPADAAQARARWSGTTAWAQFAEGAATRTPEQWRTLADDLRGWEADVAAAARDGVPPESAAADQLMRRHRTLFTSLFPLDHARQVCLGRLFAADSDFAAHYDGLAPGLARWLSEAMDAAARRAGIDPAEASWD